MSLLLDARKKVELALEQSGVHRAIEPQLSETLRRGDSSAAGANSASGLPDGASPPAPRPPEERASGGVPFTGARGDPRAAGQNLFAAKTSLTGGMRLGIIPIAIISGLVLAAGGGYYVWREISPPPVMQRHNPAPRPPEGRVSDETASQSTRLANNANQVAGYGGGVNNDRIANAIPPSVPVTQTVPAPAAPAKGIPVENKPAPADVGMKQIDHAPKVAAPYTPPAAPHNTVAQPIRIEHAQEGDAVDPVLLAAYQAYRNGDFDTALQRYSEVLRKDAQNHNTPNRDALLGMAAIAQQQSQDAIAARYYGQVLMLDPRDPIANAGMSALLGTSDVANTESRLKLLLAQQLHSVGTQSAALHFALGNLYAEQSRWGDAQQAYFNAYNLEQGNAQFAFNLAVSLDHLGQGKLAAQHYQRALQLDLSDNSGFNRAQTQQRINELTAP